MLAKLPSRLVNRRLPAATRDLPTLSTSTAHLLWTTGMGRGGSLSTWPASRRRTRFIVSPIAPKNGID